ncbi:uncharacterized protein LOC119986707 isoform X2 [Tripterygium wilfordii]|uniref:uncharacterized protein LOC119986707 isoform X2 n=1 Tax=Tripterygium wilfordii TaxID=458696 RepID=UPI0018F8247F|nr:uncharacterized protein LOC119986707 isoform X2 [Tripterygium wilfordii]
MVIAFLVLSWCLQSKMRGIGALLAARNKFGQIHSVTGSWGAMTISIPRKQGDNDSGVGGVVTKEKIGPIVAYSRPPPLPPVVGPLLALSLFEMWSSRDDDRD